MSKIAAILVTYNRVELLKLCIQSILAQSKKVDQLIIVDNNSSDDTSKTLKNLQSQHPRLITVLTLSRNTGGAGGFTAGIEFAIKSDDYEFLWLMDDDCIPITSALKELITSMEESIRHGVLPGFACSVVRHPDGCIAEMNSPVLPWDWHATFGVGMNSSVKALSCSFVSVLIPTFYIKKIGLPYAEYFIWFDDSEYTMRLSKLSEGIVALRSYVDHHTLENLGVNFGIINSKTLWKYKYGARNQSSYLLHHTSILQWVFFVFRVNRVMFKSKRNAKIVFWINISLLNGITFNPKVKYVNEK
jgi:GT2 family glycosyltransferase